MQARRTPWLWPLVVGSVALAITLWLWQHELGLVQAVRKREFDAGLRHAATRVEQRLASYEQMLLGARGLVEADPPGLRATFERHVGLLQGGADFAGLRAIGLALRVPADEAAGAGLPLAADAALRSQVLAVAPRPAPALTPLGDDLLADPALHEAMLLARDAGRAAISALVRRDAGSEPGLVLFMPVYSPGPAPQGLAARQARLMGWVFAVFRLEDMFSSLYGDDTPGLVLSLHDGPVPAASNRLYPHPAPVAAERPRFEAQEYLGIGGRTWTLSAQTSPAFERRLGQDSARLLLGAGLGLSLALVLLTWLLVTGRDRAAALARQMTRQLRDSERQYRRVVDTAHEGVWVVDRQGRMLLSNPALQELLGRSGPEMAGRHWSDFVAPADHAVAHAMARAQPVEQGELTLLRADGREARVSVTASHIIDDDGHLAGVLVMVNDITERRAAEARRSALEAQLRQSQKMEAVGTLAGGIAHGFNNIIAAVLGNLALLRQDLGPGHAALPRLLQIESAAQRARALVQQIGAFSRHEPHVLTVQPLAPVVDDSVRLLRATLPAPVALATQFTADPLPVAADASQLQQVVMNLCTNAWHALPGGAGHIEIGLARRRLDAAAATPLGAPEALQGQDCALLWVADDGCGIDADTLQRIFEPFFTTKPVGQGTGLGLSVVHGIVSGHGGAIGVHSRPGAGTRVEVWLPLATVDSPPIAPADADPLRAVASGQRLLYIDDDPVMLLMAEALLQRLGWTAQCQQNPQAALDWLQSDPASAELRVVVSDFNMPGLTGLDLARRLAQLRPGLPVIITSGYVTEALRAEVAQLPMVHLLPKEHMLDQLGPLLESLLQRTAGGSAQRAGTGDVPA